MLSSKELIQTNRAAIFDWAVLIISSLMGVFFPTLSDMIRSPAFFNWMLIALVSYTVGAALKHLPLSYRLSFSPKTVETVPYIIFLLVGHWFIIMFLVILAEPAIRSLLNLPPLTNANSASWQIITGSIVTAVIVTWMVYRTKSNRKKRKNYSPAFLFRMELAADILLIIGVSIFSFVFWEKGVMEMLDRAPNRSLGSIIFLFGFLAMLFIFFYLPLRYLFFMEDRKAAGNRKRLLLIFGFMMLRALYEALKT